MQDTRKTYSGSSDGNSVIFHLTPEDLGLNRHHDLNDQILKEISGGISHITFDLSDLNSINSSGLGILISCLKKIKENKCRLNLINVNDKIVNVFKLTKLDNVFELQN